MGTALGTTTVERTWENLLKDGRPDLMQLGECFKRTEDLTHPDDIAAVDTVLGRLADIFAEIVDASPPEQKNEKNWSRNIAKILHGCMQFDNGHTGKKLNGLDRFLTAVAKAVRRPGAPQLDGLALANALYGMKNLVACEGAEALLKALARPLWKSASISHQHIGSMLYGMKNMRSSQGTEAILLCVAPHIDACHQLSLESISSIQYGMRNLSHTPGAEAVMRALAAHIESSEQLSLQAIGNVIYGLRNKKSSEGVSAILRALVRHIRASEPLTEQYSAMALYGLRNLQPGPDTEAVLKEILSHIACSDQLGPRAIKNALQGMKNFSKSPAARQIVSALASHMSTMLKSQFVDDFGNHLFRAEVLNSLQSWLTKNPESASCQVALDMIYAMENWFGPKEASCFQGLLKRSEPGGQPIKESAIDEMLFQATRDKRSQIKGVPIYNFHGFSFELARTIGKEAMHRFMQDGKCKAMQFIIGSSTHVPANKGKMEEVVRQLVAVPGVSVHWKGPLVELKKTQPSRANA